MPEQYQVVEDWPPQTISIMRRERRKPDSRRRRRGIVLTSLIVAGIAAFLFESGVGSAIAGVRHLEYVEAWGSSAQIETYGEPRVHVFKPNQVHPPYLHLEIRNASRWTITITGVDPPLGFTEWEIRSSTNVNYIDPDKGERVRPTNLRPDQAIVFYFLGKPIKCSQPGPGTASAQTMVNEELTVRYRVAGISRAASIEGHRFVYTRPEPCLPA